jgi:UDP-glucuronate 4-epimerase
MGRILLTGGAGFIGSHVAEALVRRAKDVCIVDNFDSFYPSSWKRQNLELVARTGDFDFQEVDIRDLESLSRVFECRRPDIVIHLAAKAGVRPSIYDPASYYEVNVRGTLNLLEMCRQHGVGKFLFGSSSSVYGDANSAPWSEEITNLRPVSPYAASKVAGELLCHTYAHLYAITVICLRFFTVYGPRQRPDLAIHKFTSLIEAGLPIPIYGDGSAGRDFTHVSDIVRGVLAAIDFASGSGVSFEIFNLGNSHPIALNELVAALQKATERTVEIRHEPPQPGDVSLTWANISKASQSLGYRPQTTLEEGLANFVEWYRRDSRIEYQAA